MKIVIKKKKRMNHKARLGILYNKLIKIRHHKNNLIESPIKIKNTQKVLWEKMNGRIYDCNCMSCNNKINIWNFIMNGSFKCNICMNKNNSYKYKEVKRRIIWEKYYGSVYESSCYICKNEIINVFNFELGHGKAKALNGSDTIKNLSPICSGCNRAMGLMSPKLFQKEQKYLLIDKIINSENEIINNITELEKLDSN